MFEYTGMFAINRYTKRRKKVSEGTISYWKKKLNLSEREIFIYHQNKTKRIDYKLSYSQWTRKLNMNQTLKKKKSETKLMSLIKYAGLPKKYIGKSFDEVTMIAMNMWKSFGLNPEAELKKFYEEVDK